jgi:hypothetical protein
MLNALSLGAGVQSSTMALMAAAGEITPMPDCAIFADTHAEPKAVYVWLDWLEKQLPFPVYKVSAGSLTKLIGAKRPHGAFRIVPIPAYVKNPDGKMGGLLNRSCTRDFKIDPIRKKLRELLSLTRKRAPKTPVVTQWMGISLDEARRMKPSRDLWINNRWPLVELHMTRTDCECWMAEHGYPKPHKSACIYCPFHGNAMWRSLTPDEREEANQIDDVLRIHPASEYRSKGTLYLHKSGVPLRDIDFTELTRKEPYLFDGFGAECEGLCGV